MTSKKLVAVGFVVSALLALSVSADLLHWPAMPGATRAIGMSPPTAPPSLGLLSDAGMGNPRQEEIRRALVRQGVLDVVMAGDNLYPRSGDDDEDPADGARAQPKVGPSGLPSFEEIWGGWLRSGLRFPVVALGNHPGHKHYGDEMRFFGMPNEAYSRVLGGVRFIVLNSDNEEGVPGQLGWFERELAGASEPMIFLVYHHPTFFQGGHKPEQKAQFQTGVRPLIARYRGKLTALIVGHDHVSAVVQYNDLPVIVAGGTGEAHRKPSVDYSVGGVHVRTAWMNGDVDAAYWARLDFDPALPEARIRFMRAFDDRVGCTIGIRTGAAPRLGPDCR